MSNLTNNNLAAFNADFLSRMKEILMKATENNQCMTRTQLCKDLNVDPEMGAVISAILKMDLLPGFRVWMGPGGGIGRTDRVSVKKDPAVAASSSVPDEVAKRLLQILDRMCGRGQIVPRKTVGAELGFSSSKELNIISAALTLPEFNDFATKGGRGGGIYKISLNPNLVKKAKKS